MDRILLTLNSISETIINLIEWNENIKSAEEYYLSSGGMQLLAANCTLIAAIGEGVNRINRVAPDFLNTNFPDIPWVDIIGMQNRIAHGYFEIDAEIIYDAVKNDVTSLHEAILKAIEIVKSKQGGI